MDRFVVVVGTDVGVTSKVAEVLGTASRGKGKYNRAELTDNGFPITVCYTGSKISHEAAWDLWCNELTLEPLNEQVGDNCIAIACEEGIGSHIKCDYENQGYQYLGVICGTDGHGGIPE